MHRLTFFAYLFFAVTGFCQLKSPERFFGYPLGSTFHRHHQMVEYMRYLHEANPSRSQWISYGKTNEGRPLFVLAISAIKNINMLEQIRKSNLQSIGLLEGTPTVTVPSIAWLSYNVHGNEAVSMEAVMQVAYDLFNNENGAFDKELNNTVILLDPCINPDGRDRYANWYNQKTGALQNPDLNHWEHQEPWPGGRPNHYLFDLNRDWAWQIQIESQQRMKLYNSWMPHLHADFHEQGINSPYYFAPAAKPYHKEIPAWQREFQNRIGDYNKQEFDKNGWLYFSKERFDLLYPSYGDTYPTYNGAIGMTYEQGGSGQAGLAVIQNDGDTLTLKSRIAHHVATSFAAIKAISDNSTKNVAEFVKYFQAGVPNAEYQNYVIKNIADFKTQDFLSQLDKLDIKYELAAKSQTAVNAYSYKLRKSANLSIGNQDVVVSIAQPKGKMLKILMEHSTIVEDSATYDITAWTLPYAFGLDAYGIKEKLITKAYEKPVFENNAALIEPYAFVVKHSSLQSSKFMAQLMKAGFKIRVAEVPFEINNKSFDRGSFVVTKAGNEKFVKNWDTIMLKLANDLKINIMAVNTGMVSKGFDLGSSNFRLIKSIKIGILSGTNISSLSVGEIWHYFDQQVNYPYTILNTDQIDSEVLKDFDVLIMPNGRYARVFFPDRVGVIEKWVREGGKLIALEKANDILVGKGGFEIKNKEVKKDTNANSKIYENRERDQISNDTPGAIFKLDIENTHPVAFGYENEYASLVLEASDYALLKDGWNVAQLKNPDPINGFVGHKAKEKLKNSLMIGVQEMGQGQVVYMAINPLFRGFWQNGKLLFWNAVIF